MKRKICLSLVCVLGLFIFVTPALAYDISGWWSGKGTYQQGDFVTGEWLNLQARGAKSSYLYIFQETSTTGATYIRLGLIDEAIEEFKGSIEINPYHPGLHNNLGYLYSKRNLLKQAVSEYQKTLALDPRNPEVHKNLGLLYYYKLRDFPKAKIYWERYLTLNPGDPQNPTIHQKIAEIEKMLRSSRGHSSSP